MTPERKPPAEVHFISGAPAPHSDDLDRRMRRYLFSMAVRTACVILAVVVPGPFRWVFIVGAVVLPYVAVVMANAVGGKRHRPASVTPIAAGVLTGAVHPPPAGPRDDIPGETGEHVTLTDRVIPGSSERSA